MALTDPETERMAADSKWWGGRNTYLAVSGEHEPCAGFTYGRELFRSVVLDWCFGGRCYPIGVKAELRVSDPLKRERHFSCSVRTNPGSVSLAVIGGRCRKIEEARAAADTALSERDWVEVALKAFYARERITVETPAGEQLMTLFCGDFFLLAVGDYVVRRHDGKPQELRRYGSGYSLGTPLRMREEDAHA